MNQRSSGSIYSPKDDITLSDERKIKEDDASLSSIDEVLLNKSLKLTSFSFENIRFTPKIIEFVNAYEGKQFSEKLTIENIGRNPVLVKVGEPNSFIFQLKKPNQRMKFLPSGASLSKTITYTYHNNDMVSKSQLPVQINDCLIDFPIVVKKAQPEIEVKPQKLNFQVINFGACTKAMKLSIYNSGGKRTNFEIDSGKNLVVTPARGTVKPKHSVEVSVEVMGFSEGEYYQELWIKTSDAPIRVPVLVEVVRPRLEITYPIGTENFTLLNFQPTFKGAQRSLSFIIRNVSAETTLFVILAEVNGELQVLRNAKAISDSFDMFVLPVEEGRLEPFENRIFNVLVRELLYKCKTFFVTDFVRDQHHAVRCWLQTAIFLRTAHTIQFRPQAKTPKKGWHHREKEKKNLKCDNIIFLRIKTVHCFELKELDIIGIKYNNDLTEGGPYNENKSMLDLKDIEEIATLKPTDTTMSIRNSLNDFPMAEGRPLRLCIQGQEIEPDVLIQPTNLEFGDLLLRQTENKVLKITNNSPIPVRCKLCKKLNVKITPVEVWLKSEKSKEFLVSLSPTFAGAFKTKLKVQVFAESDVFYNTDKNNVKIAEYAVLLKYNARDAHTNPQPKVGLGITPLVKDEVGFQKELIMYKDASKYPQAAMLGLKHGCKPAWMRNEEDQVNYVDNAIIALPNDRPRLFYSWPKEKICRSIFKGFFRYSPPEDLTYTLSPEDQIKKKEHFTVWADYISRALENVNRSDLGELEFRNDIFARKLEKLGLRLDLEANTGATLLRMARQNDKVPKEALIPLCPKFLYQIQIEPKLIHFGQVAISSKVQDHIRINNLNPFPITVRFVLVDPDSLWVMEDSTITVQPSENMCVTVFLRPKEFGRFFGFLNFIINGFHEFKLPISALVLPRTLFLHEKSLAFGLYSPNEAFQPRSLFLCLENSLLSPIKYKWNLLDNSAFVIDITEGEIPPRRTLLVEIFFDLSPRRSFYSEITLISESGNSECIKLSYPCKKIAVDFLTHEVNMQDIPLNLPTKVKPVILNACYHDVSFEVLTLNPMPGVTVQPREGVIKARSFLPLHITVQIPVIMTFSFEVHLSVHFSNRISVRVTGKVVFPVVKIRPTEVTMRKVCEQSFHTVPICVVNEGTTQVEMEVDFRTCPEFTVEGPSVINLLPSKAEKMVVRFDPQNVARYVFYLPVIINKILGPPMMQERETEFASYHISALESNYKDYGEVLMSSNSKLKIPCVTINSTVLPALLQISPMSVTFRQESDSKFQPQNVTIVNVSNENVTFCVRNDDLGESNESPFDLSPVPPDCVEYRLKSIKVQLSPGEKLLLRATFDPKKAGVFSASVPVFVRGYKNGLVYNYIRLSGNLRASLIHPMSSEIYFAPVPLGVACDVIMTICAENYAVPDTLDCVICDAPNERNEEILNKLTTKWLVEPKVSGCSKAHVFRLQITFQSDVPIALRKYILLLDSSGGYATILVTAVADNSATTTHAFLTTRSSQYKLIRDTEIVKEKSETKEKEFQSSVDKIKTKSNLKPFSIEKTQEQQDKQENRSMVEMTEGSDSSEVPVLGPPEKGPRLVIQVTKSVSRTTQLEFAKIIKITTPCKTCLTPGDVRKSEFKSYFPVGSVSTIVSKVTLNTKFFKPKSSLGEITYPDFPEVDHLHRGYFERTIAYVERWMFEVVMRCDQYFSIPESFQRVMQRTKQPPKRKGKQDKHIEKDFLCFLKEFVGNDCNLPKRPTFGGEVSETEKAKTLLLFFSNILHFLKSKGCLLPHIRPEYLLEFEDYDAYTKFTKNTEFFFLENFEITKMSSSRIIDDASAQGGRNKPEIEADVKETSSGFLPKDFWETAFFESGHQLDPELEKLDERNSESTPHEQVLGSVKNMFFNKRFDHRLEVLDETTFNFRSTQAWLDIILQIFRVFVLSKICKKNTIPVVTMYEPCDKQILETLYLCSIGNYYKRNVDNRSVCEKDSLSSNIYSIQERVLLDWLNHHINVQKNILWGADSNCSSKDRILNNFDKDLSDSVALIALTASHCPYIVPHFFFDVFLTPDAPNKIQHNAGRLIQAWRMLQLGLTVETRDIIKPHPVFMLMLLTHLYEVLPLLHPRSSISFLAPLNSETSRTIHLKNDSHQRLAYQAKFFGEHDRFFRLNENSLIRIKPFRTKTITVTFSSREIRKVSATLFFCGCIESPDFGKHLAFNLEGEPSELTEYEKLSFSVPLFKVICTEIPVKSPYRDPMTYEVWYTTKKPQYTGQPGSSFKPWSVIWKTKVSRRLFLNKCEVKMKEGVEATLPITVACLTQNKRHFWLLFRSEIGSFIMLIEINTKLPDPQPLRGFYPEAWATSSCTCPQKSSPKLSNCSCSCLTSLKIPTRNEPLWKALLTMFLKTLHPKEKLFWNEYFERNIGICLMMWLLSPDEEEGVLDEFVGILPTKVTYTLHIDPPNYHIAIPQILEIPDVRERSEVSMPIHISNEAPSKLNFILKMVSENGKETRSLKFDLSQSTHEKPKALLT